MESVIVVVSLTSNSRRLGHLRRIRSMSGGVDQTTEVN